MITMFSTASPPWPPIEANSAVALVDRRLSDGFPRPHRRGRIEASTHTEESSILHRSFPRPQGRGRIEPLPSLVLHVTPSHSLVFHGLTAVAELKQIPIAHRCRQSVVVFHGLTAVAELKPRARRKGRPRQSRSFPRPHRRGRIEANHSSTFVGKHQSDVFHGFTAVAPLKHRRARGWTLNGAVFHGLTAVAELKRVCDACCRYGRESRFPRPHRRGRIEACPSMTLFAAANSVFHGFTAVAELKPPRRAPSTWAAPAVFHGLTAVAELKLLTGETKRRDVREFSTASPPWPN